MSKGHTIPLLHLTKLIHTHRPQATFTIFTTSANKPFISASLSRLPTKTVTITCLPFSPTKDGIPLGVESTDQLPSMSLFHSFAFATNNIQPHFETALEHVQTSPNPISFLITDEFLYWTQESASKFNIFRFTFNGMSTYVAALSMNIVQYRLFSEDKSKDEVIQVPELPWIGVRKDEFDSSFFVNDPQDPQLDFIIKCYNATSMSGGVLVNSFYEIEQPFVGYVNSKAHAKFWCVGPLCLADEKPILLERSEKPEWITWLDKKLVQGKPVLYVAFGSQAEISNDQLKEITIGLLESSVDFLWALRIKPHQEEILNGFDEKLKDKGLVVRSWVEQRDILDHDGVQGFLSHCGWNSTMESVCAGVPILAWPMMAEQHLNAKMVVEEIKVGLRVETFDGSPRGFVKWEGLSKMVKELMEGDMGMKAKKKVKELSVVAKKSVEKEGSSWCNLETFFNELEMTPNASNGYQLNHNA
ncbi:UDP-glycosyltransferase 90A1 [Bienertia sinuspersici]